MAGQICANCGRIAFEKRATKCRECNSPLNINPVLVTYKPDAARANNMIVSLNDLTEKLSPEDMASFIASNIAACAYMMLEMNSPATIKEVFGYLIDDAAKQRKLKVKRTAN